VLQQLALLLAGGRQHGLFRCRTTQGVGRTERHCQLWYLDLQGRLGLVRK
jgi:hypothetical protein